MIPEDRRYTKEHEWIRVDGDTGTVGITDFAQQELGDIVYVELPEVGGRIEAGTGMGTIESVKAVSELYAPVDGEVTEVNGALDAAPEQINQDPYGEGWLCKVRLSDPSQLDALLDASGYREITESK